MALIGSIRKRTGLLIGVIAIAMFAFLLMDGLSSRNRMGGAGNQNVGKIGHQKISAQYFDQKYNAYEERIRTFNPQFESDEAGRAQVRDLVWNEIAADVILGKEMEDMGLEVSLDELGNAIYGTNVHPYAKSILANPNTGQYDPEFAYAVVQGVENGSNTTPGDIKIITQLKSLIKETLVKEKYSALFNKGMYVPDFLAKDAKQLSLASADVAYIYFPYAEVSNDEITITDKDLQAYLSKNAEAYKKEATKEIQYYKIDIVPSSEDTAQALKEMQDLMVEFKDAKNDSMFVRKYSDELYGLVYFTEDQLAGDVNAANYFTDEIGTYYDPTFADGAFTITRLTDRKMLPDSVKARHILLPQPRTIEERDSLQALADSLVELIKNGADFAALAEIHSTDESNKSKGGDLGYFTQGVMTPPFNDAAFYVYKQGDAYQVITSFGLHIVKIDAAKPVHPAVRLAKVTRKLKFSKQTEKDLLNVQNEFRKDHSTPEQFEAAAAGNEYNITTVEVTSTQTDIPGLGPVREMVRWAFKEDVGSIGGFDINDQYIVAYIKSEAKEGVQPLAAVKGEITQKVANEKKAEIIKAQIGKDGAANLQELASKTGKEVKANAAVNYNYPTLEGGDEQKVAGVIFGMKEGEVSAPISGKTGVFVVQLNSKDIPQADDNLAAQKRSLKTPFNYDAALEEMKEDAGVKDMRYMFY
ncbi:MAG: peptidylprolyl isomerase [Chitinophagales bacterium]